MGAYVILTKKYEDHEVVVYHFGPTDDRVGELAFNKILNTFSELRNVPNCNSTFYFDRAAQRIAKCVIEGKGFPELLYYQS